MVLNILDRIISPIQKALKAILVIIGSAMLLIAWVHIFYRYVLNNSLSWSEEILKILLVWFCLISTSVIASERGHVSIVIFKELLPKELQQLVSLIMQIIIYLTSLMVSYIGLRMVLKAWERSTPAARVPYPLVYGALPIAFLIIALYELRNVLQDSKDYRNGKEIGKSKI